MIYPPNFGKNLQFVRKRRKRRSRYASLANDNDVTITLPIQRRKLYLDVNHEGIPVRFNPKNTYWYRNYVLYPNLECKRFRKRFRNRFRLQYHSYVSLLETISSSPYFIKWNSAQDRNKRRNPSPLSLLLLASLCYLGRGWTFHDLAEGTGISRDVHRKFFHQFVFLAKKFYIQSM